MKFLWSERQLNGGWLAVWVLLEKGKLRLSGVAVSESLTGVRLFVAESEAGLECLGGDRIKGEKVDFCGVAGYVHKVLVTI